MICTLINPRHDAVSLSSATGGILVKVGSRVDGGELHLRFGTAKDASQFVIDLAQDLVRLGKEGEEDGKE